MDNFFVRNVNSISLCIVNIYRYKESYFENYKIYKLFVMKNLYICIMKFFFESTIYILYILVY